MAEQIAEPADVAIAAAIVRMGRHGRLDRPRRGYVRACKSDPAKYTADDWREVLLASTGSELVDRDLAIRAAAAWAREHTGLAFVRLSSTGVVSLALRSALNSAIRRGEIERHGAREIRRLVVEDNRDRERPNPPIVSTEPRTLDGRETVVVLQLGGTFQDANSVVSLVLPALVAALSRESAPDGTATWRFFLGLECPHFEGLSTWLGISRNTPLPLIDLLQRMFDACEHPVQRELAVVGSSALEPLLVVTPDGVEVPSSGTVVLDDRDLEELASGRGITRRVIVLDRVRADANAQLQRLLLGDG